MAKREIKILVVDDEEEVREGITGWLSGEEWGIKVAGRAANGREALRLLEETHPDIMLLDIRMPVMNGMELLAELSVTGRTPKTVILSGYDDFNYCRQSLKYGAVDYLLKPCRREELREVIATLRKQVLAEEDHARQWDNLRKQFRNNLHILQEKLIAGLLRNAAVDIETAPVRWKSYEIKIPPKNIGTGIIRIDNQNRLREKLSPEQLELARLAVRNALHDYFRKPPAVANITCDIQDELLFLWDFSVHNGPSFLERLEKFRCYIETKFPFTITIALGAPAAGLAALSRSYHTALQAMEYSFWTGSNQIIQYDEQGENRETVAVCFPVREEAAILRCIRTSDEQRLETAVENFFLAVVNRGKTVKQHVQKFVIALFCSIYHVCVERDLNTENIFGPGLPLLDELAAVETLEELKKKTLSSLKLLVEEFPLHNNSEKVVFKALQHMEEHPGEDLSLEKVAQAVYVSPGYLSILFKKVLQKNFVTCLHEIRIRRAKELLKEHRLKVYEIAAQVGFNDEKYFSQIFKRLTGLSPNQYRDTIH